MSKILNNPSRKRFSNCPFVLMNLNDLWNTHKATESTVDDVRTVSSISVYYLPLCINSRRDIMFMVGLTEAQMRPDFHLPATSRLINSSPDVYTARIEHARRIAAGAVLSTFAWQETASSPVMTANASDMSCSECSIPNHPFAPWRWSCFRLQINTNTWCLIPVVSGGGGQVALSCLSLIATDDSFSNRKCNNFHRLLTFYIRSITNIMRPWYMTIWRLYKLHIILTKYFTSHNSR